MIRFLEHRIGDKRIIRLIRKWLKAGILEDGAVSVADSGTGLSFSRCQFSPPFGASLGIVQLVQFSPRKRGGFLDGLLSCDGVGAQPA